MRSEDVSLTSDGLRIAARMLWPAGAARMPALILCHGFGSCKENHAAFAALAAEQGWAVFSFDFRGHGASEGCVDSRTINDIGAALAWLEGQAGIDRARIALRGVSMGGYFAIHAAGQWERLAGCVAINPPDEAALSALIRDARNPATPIGRWRQEGPDFPRVMGCDLGCWLEAADLRSAVARLTPRPLLLIHCTGDERVPLGISEELYAVAGEPKALWSLEGGDHCFASRDPQVGARALDWLAAAL